MAELRAARWVIPIDDDDWLAPDLPRALPNLATNRAWLAKWPSQLIYIHSDQHR
jgi:hypothetical protein